VGGVYNKTLEVPAKRLHAVDNLSVKSIVLTRKL
jgi:hypothetical protein